MIADIGHYESEQFTKELIYDKLTEKFANIALHFTEVNTNPIKYA
jgi:putative NIF3 family GTP cyclohydrolase 1 type 2